MNKDTESPQNVKAAKSKKSAIRYAVALLIAVLILLLISYFSSEKTDAAAQYPTRSICDCGGCCHKRDAGDRVPYNLTLNT